MTPGRSSRGPAGPEGNRELVSIVIPHYNGIDLLSECLRSLKNCTYAPVEIIVVDNASTDGSADWVRTHYPTVKLVVCEKNRGYAGGCNRGAEVARGTYLLFLNNDTVHQRDWIGWLVQTLQSDTTIGAVQPKILNYFDRRRFDFAGGSGGAMDLLCFPFARGRLFLTLEEDRGQYDDEAQIFWASGTAFLIRRSLFLSAGGFDELFFAHQEEIDLQWRLQLMGYQIFVNPRSVIYHRNAATLSAASPRKKYLNHRNNLLMMLSNYSLPLATYLFPIRLALEGTAIFYAVFLRDFPHVWAILKSFFWIVTHPVTIVRKRRSVRTIRKVRDRDVLAAVYRRSIVLDYFLFGRRFYSELPTRPAS